MSAKTGVDFQDKYAELAGAAEKTLTALEDAEERALAMAVVMRWITSQNHRLGVLRGESPIMKFLRDMAEQNHHAVRGSVRRLEKHVTTDLPF